MVLKKASIALAVVLLAGGATGTSAAANAPLETVEGIIRHVAAEAPSPIIDGAAHLSDERRLVVGDQSYLLTGELGEPNTRVRATGVRTGSKFEAATIDELGPAGDSVPPSGTTEVLVMLAHWNVPDGVTPAQAATQMFTDSNGWFRDASYGGLGQTGDVTPWMEIDGPVDGKCYADSTNTMNQAKAAATNLGYDLSDYDNYVLYSPYNGWQEGSDCNGYAGWAYVGAPNTWLNGYIDRRVTVHEQGHNYGLSHSHSYLCTQVFTGTCTWSDYGDDFDAMGASGLVGHFSAPQKEVLGWMDGRTVDLTAGGQATLAPLARDELATSAVVIEATPDRSYWLEYRQRIDYDSGLPAAATNGLLVHVTDRAIASSGSNLVDTRPSDGLDVYSATLKPGSILTTPEGFTIAVGRVTPTGAVVSVVEPACPDAGFEPDNAKADARRVGVPSVETHAFCTAGDRDWVKFVATAGQAVRLESQALGPDVDTVFTLYARDGTKLARNDDYGSLASRIDFTPETDGTYFLRVRQFDGEGRADRTYDVRVSLL